LNSEKLDLGIKYYREYYSTKGLYENIIYEGIEKLLNELFLSHKSLYLVTVKPHVFAKEILDHFGLERYFLSIYGSDLSSLNKTKEELIGNLIRDKKLSADKTVMVGDRKHDILGAKYNKIKSIAVTYGYGSMKELRDSFPNYMVHNINELTDLLR
ncbi:MAG TPA: HAD hydrolase-like protein, partial [Ignavibacteria bacterium]